MMKIHSLCCAGIILLTLALTSSVNAQVVVPMSSDDTAAIKDAEAQVEMATKKLEELQKALGKKYLVVEKDDPAAGDQKWYPAEVAGIGGILYGTSSGNLLVSGSGTLQWVPDLGQFKMECESAEEKEKRLAKEAEQKKAEARMELDRKKAEEEREAKSKRIRKGFDSTDSYIFSEDYKYILQKPPQPAEPSHNVILAPGWQMNSTSGSGLLHDNMPTDSDFRTVN